MSEVTVGKDLLSRITTAFPYDAPLPSQVITRVIARPEKLKQSQKTLVGQASRLSEHSVSLRGTLVPKQSHISKFRKTKKLLLQLQKMVFQSFLSPHVGETTILIPSPLGGEGKGEGEIKI